MTKNGMHCASVLIALCMFVLLAAPVRMGNAEETPLDITLGDDGIIADYPGVYKDGSILTITLPGEYMLKGSLSDGQIIVDCEVKGKVRLLLCGVSVHCGNGPALYIKNCSPRLTIELEEDTLNELSDGNGYAGQDNIDAVIFSKSDLTITGAGTLNVKGAYRDGIVSKDDLRIKGGKIIVEAVHNGITGKDCVEIIDGEITVNAGNDGIKTTNEDAGMGYISMENGIVRIVCGDDPVSVIHGLSITGGTVDATVDPSRKPND